MALPTAGHVRETGSVSVKYEEPMNPNSLFS
jgi:hypothetical protein